MSFSAHTNNKIKTKNNLNSPASLWDLDSPSHSTGFFTNLQQPTLSHHELNGCHTAEDVLKFLDTFYDFNFLIWEPADEEEMAAQELIRLERLGSVVYEDE